MRVSLFAAVYLLLTAPFVQADAPRTFQEAKKVAWKLYAPQSTEFYCGCKYKGNKVDLASCGYAPRKNAQRASRIAHRASNGSTSCRPGKSAISASVGRAAGASSARSMTRCTSGPRPTCTTWCLASARFIRESTVFQETLTRPRRSVDIDVTY